MRTNGIYSAALAAVMALTLGGCGESETAAESGAAMPEMSDTDANASLSEVHNATGTVNSIDRAAGTINISHEPVASIGWPAMTMSFRMADPDSAEQLTPGQRIDFEFTIEDGGTVTAVEPAE